MGQVIKRKEAEKLALDIKKQGKTMVFTNGCFDILHIGHVRYLKESAKFGDYLIIGLNSDSSVKRLKGETRPINNESDRAELLSELSFVDYVVIFDEDTPQNLLDEIKPEVYTKGADYTLDTLPEAKTVLKNGGRVEFINLVEIYKYTMCELKGKKVTFESLSPEYLDKEGKVIKFEEGKEISYKVKIDDEEYVLTSKLAK